MLSIRLAFKYESGTTCSAKYKVWNRLKITRNGGAIALGHPVGASGARILYSLALELKERQEKYGLATLCIGGGQGISLIIERV